MSSAARHVAQFLVVLAVMAAAAWLSWALGRSTHAAHYLDQALATDSELTFAQLLRTVVDAGMLPDWSFRAAAA